MGRRIDRLHRGLTDRIAAERPLLVLLALAVAAVGTRVAAREARAFHGHGPRPAALAVPGYFTAWRARYLDAMAPVDRDGLVRGIFLGDDSSVSAGTRAIYKNAGLTHLLAASGFNCAIVALFFGAAAAAGLRMALPRLPARTALAARLYAPEAARLTGAWLFWLWSDQSPPITRAALMVSLKAACAMAELAAPFWRLLTAQYLASLALDPALWSNASFQLTFGCLFGLIALPKLVEPFAPARGGARWLLWIYLWTNLGAIAGTLPTTLAFFGEANFMSLLTNWFAVPPVSFALMPLSLARMLMAAPGLESLEATAAPLARLLEHAPVLVARALTVVLELVLERLPSLRFFL